MELYEQLAWAGIEEAQANAAHLLHRAGRSEEAMRYYTLSAEQGSSHSHLMLGDHFYATRRLNTSLAAYRRAADLRHHEAMFNLGYMYERGEGVPRPDVHLAKRFYDLAYATNPASMYAVYLSLAHLYLTTTSLSGLIKLVDMSYLWNDGVLLTLLCMVLATLLIFRAR